MAGFRWGGCALIVVAGLASGSLPQGAASAMPSFDEQHTIAGTGAPASSAKAMPIRKVLTIVIENHTLREMRAGMPYLKRLSERFAYALRYDAIMHPSLPNYLAIAGGSTFGVTTNAIPRTNGAKVGRARSVFGQALAHGRTAKVYAESMPTNCATTSSGRYVVKHNPWPFFRAERASCKRFDVPAGTPARGALARDIARGTLPNVAMLIPNLCNDAHDCSLGTADRWLKRWIPSLLNSRAFTTGRLAVVVTADEGSSGHRNRVLTVVMHKGSRHGQVVRRRLDHYSLSRLYSQVVGTKPLRYARTSVGMRGPFDL
jgi:hypothetical protein